MTTNILVSIYNDPSARIEIRRAHKQHFFAMEIGSPSHTIYLSRAQLSALVAEALIATAEQALDGHATAPGPTPAQTSATPDHTQTSVSALSADKDRPDGCPWPVERHQSKEGELDA